MDSLLQQLPSRYKILGDFNGHNILWGNKNNDSRGKLIENFLTKNDICIMNDKSYTYHSSSTKSFTYIDLSFCHLYHCFLIIIGLYVKTNTIVITSLSSLKRTLFSTEDHNPKWKLNGANWDLFHTLSTGKLIPETSKNLLS